MRGKLGEKLTEHDGIMHLEHEINGAIYFQN
jgi:hypothetical protein